jgi:hypothetical protein
MDTKIFDALVENDFALLDMICHGSIAGDSAAIASKGILCILERWGENAVEEFLKRLVIKRVADFRIKLSDVEVKSKDLADITRDNRYHHH